MYLLLFLVSPTCPLLQSDQSQALALHGQALSITLPCAHFLVFHLYLTCLYLPFAQNIIREEPHNCLYQSSPELRFSTYTDESTHQIRSYGLLFLTFYHFLCTKGPPTSTAPTQLSLTFARSLPTIPYTHHTIGPVPRRRPPI